jgi:dienelactone hydrolase
MKMRLQLLAAAAMSMAPLTAQTPLVNAVNACLDTVDEADYARQRDVLLARSDATGDSLLAAVTTRPAPLRGETTFVVPCAGTSLTVKATAPTNRDPDRLLPVLYAFNGTGDLLPAAELQPVIVAGMSGYQADQFSDRERDAHWKTLNAIAWHTGGDPNALWWTGFSWGGHACWDDTMHRPGWARGFVGRGGGPRRTSFRLLPNLVGTELLSVCGTKEDPELLWNLREVQRTHRTMGLRFTAWEAADHGHVQPLPGEREAGLAMFATPCSDERPQQFTLLADGPNVEHPLFVVLDVDARAVLVPDQVPVSSTLSPDEQRRATLRAMQKQVASVRWQITGKGAVKTVTLQAKGVRRGRLAFRAPWFAVGEQVRVLVGNQQRFAGALQVDARTLLDEARRTGDRLRPALRVVELVF